MSDGLVISLACYASWAVARVSSGVGWPVDWRVWVQEPMAVAVVPLALFSMVVFQVYRPRRDGSFWAEQKQVIKASLATVFGLIVLLWSLGAHGSVLISDRPVASVMGHHVDATRFQLAVLAVAQTVMLCAHRLAFRVGLRWLRRRGRNLRHVAVVGVGRLGRIVCRTLDRNGWTGIHVAFFVSHRDRNRRTSLLGRPVLGGLDDLEPILDRHRPDAVYLAIPNQQAAALPMLLRRLEKHAVDVRIVPDVHPRYLHQSMVVHELDGMPVLSYRENPQGGLGGVSKRVLDVLGALAALILFSPAMLAAALAVRLSSPGPVIFKQRRVSLGGEVFNIYKFRTMFHVEDEQAPASWTARHDPRVTGAGRWLRRTSLDELPQLFNVLAGDMSLVGPRPERPELIEGFRENWRAYVLRQHVKAGITGWAQVNGLRGDTCLRKRLQHDLFYIRHWSLGFDVKILWLTLFRGFVHRNAH